MSRRLPPRAIVAALALALTLAACSGDDDPAATGSPGSTQGAPSSPTGAATTPPDIRTADPEPDGTAAPEPATPPSYDRGTAHLEMSGGSESSVDFGTVRVVKGAAKNQFGLRFTEDINTLELSLPYDEGDGVFRKAVVRGETWTGDCLVSVIAYSAERVEGFFDCEKLESDMSAGSASASGSFSASTS